VSVWTILMLIATFITVLAFVMTVINLRIYRPSRPDATPEGQPLVSVCVPARNEETNIEACVRSIQIGRASCRERV
jgi:cellulose synthase/poly-beta-1,6-N-acetylglucosamine synthase-like glycosyltransferase